MKYCKESTVMGIESDDKVLGDNLEEVAGIADHAGFCRLSWLCILFWMILETSEAFAQIVKSPVCFVTGYLWQLRWKLTEEDQELHQI